MTYLLHYNATITVIVSFGIFGIVFINLFQSWEKHFSRYKLPRLHHHSPSNKCPPTTKSLSESIHSALSASDHKPDSYFFQQLRNKRRTNKKPVRRKSSGSLSSFTSTCGEYSLESTTTAHKLDMNHVYVSFSQYIWASLFVGLPAAVFWLRGIAILWLRDKLHNLGWIKPKPFDPANIVAKLCLEGTMVINYLVRDGENKDLVGFYYPKFPVIKSNGDVYVAGKQTPTSNRQSAISIHGVFFFDICCTIRFV